MAAEEEDSHAPSCMTQQVLETAQVDLKNAEWPGMMGSIAGSVRTVIARPALSVATAVVPPVASRVPFLDNVSSAILGAAFHVVRASYAVLPHVPSLREQAHEEITLAAANAVEAAAATNQQEKKEPNVILAIPSAVMSLGAAMFGYGINATLDLVTSPEEKHAEWSKVSKEFVGYLKQYGIDQELKTLIKNPRLNINMLIMSRIQHDLNSTADRRQRTAVVPAPFVNNAKDEQDLAKRASRFIKYSIAAYGVYMMESYEEARKLAHTLLGDENFRRASTDSNGSAGNFLDEAGSFSMDDIMDVKVGRIAKFLNIEKSDVKFATEPGGDLKLLGHFVAIDHETKSVVLAIRGTHNTSEWVADFDATAVPFCGGVAHKGMAERATNLWENRDTRNAVARALYYNEGYQFVVCGQSLGAGVANLVNIKCHHEGENLFQGKKSTCFSYGGPPVFAYTPGIKESKGIAEAFVSSYNYIHGKDVVAHASIDAVRRVISTLDALDGLTSQWSPVDRYLLARGAKKPSDAMVHVVSDGSKNMASKPGANRLKLPSKFIVWFKQVSDDPVTFDTCYCDPNAVSDLCIFLDIRMCTDHLPVGYELALETIAGTAH